MGDKNQIEERRPGRSARYDSRASLAVTGGSHTPCQGPLTFLVGHEEDLWLTARHGGQG